MHESFDEIHGEGMAMIDRSAFHVLSYGLYLVTAIDEKGKKYGCVANTFQQVASDPPMVSIALHRDNATTKAIKESGKYAVSVLDETATMELIGLFGFRSSLDVDKFGDVDHEMCSSDLPRVRQSSVAVFSIEVKEIVDAGTHLMFVGKVLSAERISDKDPLTYAFYHKVLKGKTPPKAVSFVEESTADVVTADGAPAIEYVKESSNAESKGPRYGWRCKLCGYIEMTDELPDDYVCPICGVGKDMFERIEI